jgi:hypothetical protein
MDEPSLVSDVLEEPLGGELVPKAKFQATVVDGCTYGCELESLIATVQVQRDLIR